MHVQHQLTNRRLSNTNSQISIGLGSNSLSPNKHGEPSSSYTNGSVNTTTGSNNNLTHKSASNITPASYPLGRPANSINTSNNRTMGMNPQSSNGFSDLSSTSNNSRDSRISPGVIVGQMMGQHSGNGIDCLNPTLLGKYVDKESSAQAANPLSRWPLLAGDSSGVGGGGGDLGMQQNGSGQVITSGNGSGVNAQKNLALGDGAQSLPSLKDSGLLDSWGSSRAAVDTPNQASNGSPQQQQSKQQQLLATLQKTATLGSSISMALPSTAHYTQMHNQDVPDLRPTTLGMPVGMSWLANESR